MSANGFFAAANGNLFVGKNVTTFYQGNPQDWDSKAAAYHSDLTWESPTVVRVMTWMKQLFPEEDVRHFALKYVASLLGLFPVDKHIVILQGGCSSGKTTFVELLRTVLGSRCFRVHRDYMKPQLLGYRSQHDKISPSHTVAIIEDMARPLQESEARRLVESSITENRNLIICATELSEVIASTSRLDLVILPIKSTYYCSFDAETPDNHYPQDPRFYDYLDDLAPAMLWIMCQYYPTFRDEGLVPTESMTALI